MDKLRESINKTKIPLEKAVRKLIKSKDFSEENKAKIEKELHESIDKELFNHTKTGDKND